jgi:hypothetical protein
MANHPTKKGFMAWLKELGHNPCGEPGRCPLAVYTGNWISLRTARPWAGDFMRWADSLGCGWWQITASRALEYLRRRP